MCDYRRTVGFGLYQTVDYFYESLAHALCERLVALAERRLNALLAGEPAREHRIVLELLRILALELAEVALYERIYSNALVVGIEYRRGVGAALKRTRYDRADGRIDKLRAHILELFSALFAELNVGVTDIFSLGLLLCRAASYDIDYIAFHVSSKNTLSILLNCMIENS